jgi:anti-sigma28 factor (negative regulator of flagellin synthesis)
MERAKRGIVDLGLNFEGNKDSIPRRKRSMTTLNLQWVADRCRKARKIKEKLDSGTYQVDSRQVASSMVGLKAIKVKGSNIQ